MSATGRARSSMPLAGLVVGGLLAGVLCVSAIGVGGAWMATVLGVASAWVTAGALAGAYVAAAWGLGAAVLKPMGDRSASAWLAPAVGLGLMLTLSHGMGVLGAFDWAGVGGRRIIAGLPLGFGLVLLALDVMKRRAGEGVGVHPAVLMAAPGLGVLIVAAASPPGWLWASEGLGYDTRSYHAQLPAEWLAQGRLWPLEHNVYSFLPGSMEAAFFHLASLVGSHPASGSGVGVLAFQCLSAVVMVLAVVLLGRVCWLVLPHESREKAGGIATAVATLVLATPWMIVVGGLAYNEPAVLALGAGALLAALSLGHNHALRWMLAALLVGAACGAKPTALILVAPAVAALLIASTPVRAWARCAGLGALVGVATLLPWLVRNGLATGNPVFPQLSGVFGKGHWTAEQHARWASGHVFDGSVLDRVKLLFLPDPAGPHLGGTSMRGLLHPQWGVLGVACMAAAVAGPLVRRHAVVIALAGGFGVQIIAWLALTHLQSRFLIPIVLTGGPLLAVVLARLGRRGVWIAVGLATVQGGWAVWSYSKEGRGQPGMAIAPGVVVFTGELDTKGSPQGMVNFGLPEVPGRVLLVGDAAPLYVLREPLYATTWDTGLLVGAIEANPDHPAAQAAALRAAGVRWLVIDELELSRLRVSGWLHPALSPRAIGELAARGTPVGYWPGPGALGRILIDLGPLE